VRCGWDSHGDWIVMRRHFNSFAIVLALLSVVCAQAVDRITATVTITGGTTNGMTVQVNADTRTWTNNATGAPASTILTNATIAGVATNWFAHIGTYPYSGILPQFTATNQVKLIGASGGALAVTIGGGWATVSYATSVVTTLTAVRVPMTGEPTASSGTNIASLLVSGINSLSTNSLTEGTIATTNLVGKTAVETMGNKSLTNTVLIKFGGNLAVFNTNGIFGSNLSGGTNTGNYISFDATGWPTVVDSGGNSVTGEPDSLGGIVTVAHLKAFYPLLEDNGGATTNVWNTAQQFVDPVYAAAVTATNATIQAGTVTASLTNVVEYAGGPVMLTLSSLANGDNAAVPAAGYRFVKLTAGPSAAFAVCGIAGGGVREITFYNATGQAMTVKHQSGGDPTATNRIVSLTGADQVTTADGAFHVIYDTVASRWLMDWFSP
jgi:hypothetical protein